MERTNRLIRRSEVNHPQMRHPQRSKMKTYLELKPMVVISEVKGESMMEVIGEVLTGIENDTVIGVVGNARSTNWKYRLNGREDFSNRIRFWVMNLQPLRIVRVWKIVPFLITSLKQIVLIS